MKIERLEDIKKSKELLPQIVDRIFLVCRNDPSFHLKNEMQVIEDKMDKIQQKILKQEKLLEQSNNLSKDLLQRIEILSDQNERKQIELLESLGSEL